MRNPSPTGAGTATDQAQRLRVAETLVEVSKTVAAMETLDDVLRSLVELTTRETNADRGTLFLNDPETNELFSRVALGQRAREIRIPNDSGIAGRVFQTGAGVVVHDTAADPHFNPDVDQQTGYDTRSIVCAPVRTAKGDIIGVAQVLNKLSGSFTDDDLLLLEAMTTQAAVAMLNAQYFERMQRQRAEELMFLELVADITSELDLGALLERIMQEATRMLNADRSTLFLNEGSTSELVALIAQGEEVNEIRFPNDMGIAGTVFTTGQSINIPYAYADLRFNPNLDRQTGYFTRSILCVPVVTNAGETIGVTQVLNKRGGPFTSADEQRLKAFTAQVAIALQNAKLFHDVQSIKNYNEAVLQSMSNGVLTLDTDRRVATFNTAAAHILGLDEAALGGKTLGSVVGEWGETLSEMIDRVDRTSQVEMAMDVDLRSEASDGNDPVAVNLTALPLVDGEQKIGTMIVLEDITGEKRVRSTMARYMDPSVADQLVRREAELLGGKSTEATILFSDIRSFTTISEELGPQGTVTLLNEYFTLMVDCIQHEGGMLDKFIGDAIMAGFGLPLAHGDDPDRAVRAAVSMISALFDWNRRRAAEGRRAIDMGVGINTADVVVGNIGSAKRMDFTVIGDGVNLASRLEGACKEYGARILISESTYRELRGVYRTREVDRVIVKGKTQPIGVYEVLDYHTSETFPNLTEVVNLCRDGIEKYRHGDWDGAIRSFDSALAENPSDGLARAYVDRCEQLKAHPPSSWDGVWTMTSK